LVGSPDPAHDTYSAPLMGALSFTTGDHDG
jgi:hypothetical protein